MKLLCLIILPALTATVLYSQEINNCGSGRLHDSLLIYDAGYFENYQKAESLILQKTIAGGISKEIYTIPVVFHLICRPGSQPGDFSDGNPDDNTVIGTFLQNLNDAYRNAGSFDQGVGQDMEIEFCLATKDTNGLATTGIVRFETDLADSCGMYSGAMYTDSVKKMTSWDPTRYYNIWIVASLQDASGFATFPWSLRDYHDGVIIDIAYLSASYMAGVMLAHETGHYFGLYHVFQGGCPNNNCLVQGDRICDTPPSTEEDIVFTCIGNTCMTDADDTTSNNPFTTDMEDNLRTYMNYGLPTCINQFTPGQKDRARICLETFRDDILQSDGCEPSGVSSNPAPLDIKIFPQPAGDKCTVVFPDDGPWTIYIFDLSGRILYQSETIPTTRRILSLESLSNGSYLLKVTGRQCIINKMFVRSHY